MLSLFLFGGGSNAASYPETYARFVEAATSPEGCRIALVIAEEAGTYDEDFLAYTDILKAAGASPTDILGIRVSPMAPLQVDHLSVLQPTAIFICGGLTPDYQEALCIDRTWLDYATERNLVLGGVSAGAAIVSELAIVGGWRAERRGQTRQILFQGASEGRDLIDVRPGLGLLPFAIDVHASQWGTLTRLIHAVELGLVQKGLAIDEDTMLHVQSDSCMIFGSGHVYAVTKDVNTINVNIYTAGDRLPNQNR